MKFKLFGNGCIATVAVILASCSSSTPDTILSSVPSDDDEQESTSTVNSTDLTEAQQEMADVKKVVATGGANHTSHDDFGLSALTIVSDLSGEDVAYTKNEMFFCYDYDLDNRDGSYRRTINSWNQLYDVVDKTNDVIALLKNQTPCHDVDITLGQAYSLRAYSYFWLVNLWQQPLSVNPDAPGVPLVTDVVDRRERVPVKEIYDQILSDIDRGYNYLKGYGYYTDKTDISEYAAAAIYAKILMFTGDYAKAAEYAEKAIAGGSLNSHDDMLSGFNSLSMPEVIYGAKVDGSSSTGYASFFSHVDAYMNGYGGNEGYRKLIASDLYDKITDNDVRKQWFGYRPDYNTLDVDFDYEFSLGFEDYIPCKFRDNYLCGFGTAYTSDLIYIRVAEMYLIAAEAYYLDGNQGKAREMLNTLISTRIDGYSFMGVGKTLYNEICLQKRIEMWMEGCRLLDIKRRNETVDRSTSINHAVNLANLDAVTFTGQDYRLIYHIPTREIESNPYISASDDNK